MIESIRKIRRHASVQRQSEKLTKNKNGFHPEKNSCATSRKFDNLPSRTDNFVALQSYATKARLCCVSKTGRTPPRIGQQTQLGLQYTKRFKRKEQAQLNYN